MKKHSSLTNNKKQTLCKHTGERKRTTEKELYCLISKPLITTLLQLIQ